MTDPDRPARSKAATANAAAAEPAERAAAAERLADAEADAAADAPAAASGPTDNDEVDGPSSADYSVAFSPRQVAVGLAIVAGLVAVVAARRRRGGRGREG